MSHCLLIALVKLDEMGIEQTAEIRMPIADFRLYYLTLCSTNVIICTTCYNIENYQFFLWNVFTLQFVHRVY